MRHLAVPAGVLLIGLAACAHSPTQPELAKSQVCLEQDLRVRAVSTPTLDNYFDVLDALLPGGFGGLTISYYFLVEPAKAPAVRARIDTLLACPGAHAPNLTLLRSLPARQGLYSWTQLHTWYRQLQESQPPPSGLLLSDIDESRNQLSYGFASDEARAGFLTRLPPLGIPTSAVYTYLTTPITP